MEQTLYILDHCRLTSEGLRLGNSAFAKLEGYGSKDPLDLLYEKMELDYPKFYKMDRLCKPGFLAAELLLGRNPLPAEERAQMALLLASAQGCLDTDRKYAERSRLAPSPALFVYTLPNIVAGEIGIRQGIRGEGAFFLQPAFDAEWMAMYAGLVMQDPELNYCLAGWIEGLDAQTDVFLYLIGKADAEGAMPHSAQQLAALYQPTHGTING